jgi:hypothetical protein
VAGRPRGARIGDGVVGATAADPGAAGSDPRRHSHHPGTLTVFAGLAINHWIEHQTGWSVKQFVRATCRYRTMQIRAGQQTLAAADPPPDDLRNALTKITSPDNAH